MPLFAKKDSRPRLRLGTSYADASSPAIVGCRSAGAPRVLAGSRCSTASV